MPSGDSIRAIKKIWRSMPAIEGAGVRLNRAFGFREEGQLDPFLLLDDFRSDNPADYAPGFPWHPHRGIETITYVLDGEVAHEDSMGNGGVIGAGDIQWMTAGSGIFHQEMPKGTPSGRMHGFQLWANLPAGHKMMEPRYRDVRAGTVPAVKTPEGAEVRVIAGKVGEVVGPVRDIVTDPEYLDVSLAPGSSFEHAVPADHTVFAYVIGGEGRFEPEREGGPGVCANGTLVLFGEGESVRVSTEGEPARFLLASGRPIGEPIAWHGPIVMNTQEELRVAFEEFRKGTFIKTAGR